MVMKKIAIAFVALALFVVISARAKASTYTASEATTASKKEASVTLKASATFVVSNLDLVVTLSNTGTYDPRNPADILTGVFFKLAGDQHLTPVAATVASGSSVIGHRLPLGFSGDVSGEWAYTNNLAYAPSAGIDDNEGISSTKLKWFKKKDLFGEKIRGTSPLSGAQFGITTLDDLASNDKGGIKNKALIQTTVVFVFDNLPSGFTVDDISGVTFQYGTSIKSGIDTAGELVAQLPEPNTISLVVVGLLGAVALTGVRARRR
jgi:hypothetical protein